MATRRSSTMYSELNQVYAPPQSSMVVAHIVAVHGLWGHKRETWEWNSPPPEPKPKTSSSKLSGSLNFMRQRKKDQSPSNAALRDVKSVFWLQDLLPEVIPNTRIFSWTYNSSATNIHDIANALLSDLHMRRAALEEINIPIIFIAHSLGGLVVKEAIILSKQQVSTFEKTIAKATWGIIFLGTPHRGSRRSPLVGTVAKIAKFIQPRISPFLIFGSQWSLFLRLNQEFLDKLSPNTNILTVVEALPTKSVGIIVDNASATLEWLRETQVSINATHLEMTKFKSGNDDGFRLISSELKRWTATISSSLPNTESLHTSVTALNGTSSRNGLYLLDPLSNNSTDENDGIGERVLSSLYHPQSRARESKVPFFHPNSFSWVLKEDSQLIKWLHSPRDNLYWIYGKAGSGKSTLMKHVLAQLPGALKSPMPSLDTGWPLPRAISIGFFFNSQGPKEQKSAKWMLQSIVFDLLSQNNNLVPKVHPYYRKLALDQQIDAPVWDIDSLFLVLENIMSQDEYPLHIRLFIDALDECEDISELMNVISRLVSTSTNSLDPISPYRLKVCVSSRQLLGFDGAFKTFVHMNLVEYTANDIRLYVQDQLRLPDPEKSSAVAEAVVENANGVFLWVRLVVESLLTGSDYGASVEELIQRLFSIPKDLQSLFEWKLSCLPQEHMNVAKIMMQLALHRPRTFVLEDLVNCTRFIAADFSSNVNFVMPEAPELKTYVTSRSAGLLEALPFLNSNDESGQNSSHPQFHTVGRWQNSPQAPESFGKTPQQARQQSSEPSSRNFRFIHDSIPAALMNSQKFLGGNIHLDLLQCVISFGNSWAQSLCGETFRFAKLAEKELSTPKDKAIYISTVKRLAVSPLYNSKSGRSLSTPSFSTTGSVQLENFLEGSNLQSHFVEYFPDDPESTLLCLAVAANLLYYVEHEFHLVKYWRGRRHMPSLLRIAAVGEGLNPGIEDRLAMVKLLLSLGVDVNEKACDTLLCRLDHLEIDTALDCTTLSWVTAEEQPTSISRATRDSLVSLLLERGARRGIAQLPLRSGGAIASDRSLNAASLTFPFSTFNRTSTSSTLRTVEDPVRFGKQPQIEAFSQERPIPHLPQSPPRSPPPPPLLDPLDLGDLEETTSTKTESITNQSPAAKQQSVPETGGRPYPNYPIPIPPEQLDKALKLYKDYITAVAQERKYQYPLATPLIFKDTSYVGVTDLESVISFHGDEIPPSEITTKPELSRFDGKIVKQRVRKRLSPEAKAKAALVRWLGSCWVCRKRRVPCPLDHHDIEALDRILQTSGSSSRPPTKEHNTDSTKDEPGLNVTEETRILWRGKRLSSSGSPLSVLNAAVSDDLRTAAASSNSLATASTQNSLKSLDFASFQEKEKLNHNTPAVSGAAFNDLVHRPSSKMSLENDESQSYSEMSSSHSVSDSDLEDGLTYGGLESHDFAQSLADIAESKIKAALGPLKEDLTAWILSEINKIVESYYESLLGAREEGEQTKTAGTQSIALATEGTSDYQSQSFSASTPTGTTSTSARNQDSKSLKSGRRDDEEDQDENDGRKSKKQKKPPKDDPAKPVAEKFACHFYKRQPLKYRGPSNTRFNSCANGFPEVYRIKTHITKIHCVPVYCPVCYIEFNGDKKESSEDKKELHIQQMNQDSTHLQKAKPTMEGITRKQHSLLEGKKNRGSSKPNKKTEIEYWKGIWVILFPGEPIPDDTWHFEISDLISRGEVGNPLHQSYVDSRRHWVENYVEIGGRIVMAHIESEEEPILRTRGYDLILPLVDRVYQAVCRHYEQSSRRDATIMGVNNLQLDGNSQAFQNARSEQRHLQNANVNAPPFNVQPASDNPEYRRTHNMDGSAIDPALRGDGAELDSPSAGIAPLGSVTTGNRGSRSALSAEELLAYTLRRAMNGEG